MIICSIPVGYAIDRSAGLERGGHGPFDKTGLICLLAQFAARARVDQSSTDVRLSGVGQPLITARSVRYRSRRGRSRTPAGPAVDAGVRRRRGGTGSARSEPSARRRPAKPAASPLRCRPRRLGGAAGRPCPRWPSRGISCRKLGSRLRYLGRLPVEADTDGAYPESGARPGCAARGSPMIGYRKEDRY